MRNIFKYEIPELGKNEILIPYNAQILSVGEQDNKLFLWALVDPSSAPGLRTIILHGTGHEIKHYHNLEFIQTVQMKNGLVWHIFEE